ncbi:unnamed protein product, partial [Tetraodon nigroviridis]
WYHSNITRSKAEDLLSKAARDGSFLIRDSESIQGAYALCVLYQKCVYTYRILPSEHMKLSVQASEGVPIRFFSVLPELVDAYYNPNMGLVTHLQYSVQREEEIEEEPESYNPPPQLPPRIINDVKDSEPKCSEQSCKPLQDTFLTRLQHMDLSGIPEEHQVAIQEYFRTSVCSDIEQVQSGHHNLLALRKLIMAICKNLNSEISHILPVLEVFHKALDQQLSPGTGQMLKRVGDLYQMQNEKETEKKQPLKITVVKVQYLTLLDSMAATESLSYRLHGSSRIICLLFSVNSQVKQESLGIPTKMFLKVDVESGKLYFKKSKDGPEDKCFGHNKILQLVKSQKMPVRLFIGVETEKEKILRKEFVFENTKKREAFCQLLQQMKNKHSEKPEPDMITVFVGTWNMGNAGPPHNISSWFQCKGQGKTRDDTADYIPHDIYVIGTQEDPLSERELGETVKGVLRNLTSISFKQVAIHTLWNIRIIVLAKPEHENRISHVLSDSVKTGIANTLGNKGAVGVSFMFNGTSFGFVNSHLTSGNEKKLRRNQNYISILRFLNLGDKKLSPFDITHRFTHLFWLGDLNYRIDFPFVEAENIVTKIKQQQFHELLGKDQLSLEKNEGKVFLHFGCTTDITTSDHSPVFASFEVGVASQFVSKQGPNSEPEGGIQIKNCVATLLTKSKTKFFIEFHSSCLEREGCVALRAAELCYMEFEITLTHQGEKTGTMTGGIQLRTSEGKPTEKLYGESARLLRMRGTCGDNREDSTDHFFLFLDFIKIEKDDTNNSKGRGGDLNK